jgi:xanthine dehydrogenase accessory factor
MKSSDLLELSRELTRQNQPHAWITVISVTSPSSSYVGAQAIVRSDGELSGWIGGGCVQSAARAAALRSIASAVPLRLRLSNTKDPSEAIDVRPMACASNGEVELFIQPAAVAPRLRIYGNTPIVRIAAWLAREADFDPLTDQEAADVEALANSLAQGRSSPPHGPREHSSPAVAPVPPLEHEPAPAIAHGQLLTREPPPAPTHVPSPPSEPAPVPSVERETYALIATQGDGDESALEAALRSCARAVLVIASRRKAERLRTAMKLRGISQERIDAMHAPAGPDIGAVTPNEIALAAVAGLVALRRGHAPSPTQHTRPPHTKHAPTSVETQPVTGYVNPVCGAVVDPARALSSLTMSGQTHYFCCQGCRTEFERDPEKYLETGSHMREPARTTHE